MTPKIEWFQEILDQEPSSRVFFPLAKLFFESGEVPKAIDTLKRGLEHHPDFLEARLFLIHLLYTVKDMDGCSSEITWIANMFNQYPEFWIAWGQSGAQTGGEFGLYMGLISALVMHPNLTLFEFLSQGLKGLSEKAVLPSSQSSEVTQESNNQVKQKDFSIEPNPQLIVTECLDADAVTRDSVVEKVSDENCSLCTRSMAELLVEQGDIAGAIKIYQELESKTTDKEEITSLHARQRVLTDKLAESKNTSEFGSPHSVSYGMNLQGGVINMLEALVERLEKRAKF